MKNKILNSLVVLFINVVPALITYITAIMIDFKPIFMQFSININQHLPIIIFISVLFVTVLIYSIAQTIKQSNKVTRLQNLYVRYFHLLIHENGLLTNGKITDKMLNDTFSKKELKDLMFGETDINRIKKAVN